MTPRELFGGAVMLNVPDGWLDTEQFMDIIKRPVPDNQEIFVAPASPGSDARPVALFIDVLEAATDKCPDMASAPHFHALEVLRRDERDAEADGLVMAAEAVPLQLPAAVQAGGGKGAAATWSSFASCDLDVCVVRIPSFTTDIVLSLHGRASSAEDCPELPAIVSTLQVIEWGLFGEGDGHNDGDDDRYLGS